MNATELLDFMRGRRSLRRYLPDQVPRDAIECLLEAAIWAPSAHNRQPWRFVIINERATKERLAREMGNALRRDLVADGLESALIEADVGRSYERITSAPLLIMVCMSLGDMDLYADEERSSHERTMAQQSAAMAGQNMLLMAEKLGLGACWMCAPLFCQALVAAVLRLPSDWIPQGMITLGYPAQRRERSREPLGNEGVVALDQKIAVLIGGVGGAKLASGLVEAVAPESLTFIVNTGDDFRHLGLKICPDLDTLMYTLAGVVNPELGWGVADDSTVALDSLARHYRIEPWFRLGDKDLATHLLRTDWLRQGRSLTEATACLARRLGAGAAILPMCDEDMPTMVDTVERGELGFQEYFVKYAWQPVIRAIRHHNCERAQVAEPVRKALLEAEIVLIAPSNPWLSLAPILAIPGMRGLLDSLAAPRVAVTPIIAGDAVKGPAAKIMRELGLEVSAREVARFYGGLLDGFVDDLRSQPFAIEGLRTIQLNTLMRDQADKVALARATLDWIGGWAR